MKPSIAVLLTILGSVSVVSALAQRLPERHAYGSETPAPWIQVSPEEKELAKQRIREAGILATKESRNREAYPFGHEVPAQQPSPRRVAGHGLQPGNGAGNTAPPSAAEGVAGSK